MASGQCPDELTLQLYLEGETDAPVEELIFHHLAYCRVCAYRLEQMRDVKMFCLERLGEEDLREAAHTQRVLQEAQDGLQKALPPIPAARRAGTGKLRARAWWKRLTMAAAVAFAVAMGGFWLLSEKQPALSAKAVLDEAEMRERLWEYQQGKVLHWVIESSITNSIRSPDGHFRSLRWRSNVAGRQASLIRTLDAQGNLMGAYWIRPDGSEVVFSQRDNDKFRITPSLAEMRAALATWPADQRQELESLIAEQEASVNSQNEASQVAEAYRRNWEAGKLSVVDTPDFGRVFRVRIESAKEMEQGRVKRLESDQDMSATTFRRIRLSSRRWLADGRIWTEEARWTLFRESSLEEFAANDLSAMLEHAKNVERVSVKEHTQRLLEMRRKRRKNDARPTATANR